MGVMSWYCFFFPSFFIFPFFCMLSWVSRGSLEDGDVCEDDGNDDC